MKSRVGGIGLAAAACLLMFAGSAIAGITVQPAPGDSGKGAAAVAAAAPIAKVSKEKSSIVVAPDLGAETAKKTGAKDRAAVAVVPAREPVQGKAVLVRPVAKEQPKAADLAVSSLRQYRSSADERRHSGHTCEDADD
jgi:hypothetical protein